MQLFDRCVTASVLWCCESWTLTREERRRLKSVQNGMLRKFAGPRRTAGEGWVDWIQRATRQARLLAESSGVKCWVSEHLRRKWRWAGHVAEMLPCSWPQRTTKWRDAMWCKIADMWRIRPRRPKTNRWLLRWEDEISRYMGAECKILASARDTWRNLEEDFVKKTLK